MRWLSCNRDKLYDRGECRTRVKFCLFPQSHGNHIYWLQRVFITEMWVPAYYAFSDEYKKYIQGYPFKLDILREGKWVFQKAQNSEEFFLESL